MGRMTCPHCGNIHPDGTAFCPETGQPIARTVAQWLAHPGPEPHSRVNGSNTTVG